MDSDCLIKLVKSSLKEIVCRSFDVVIPPLVKKEVVDHSVKRPDAVIVKNNLERKLLTVSTSGGSGAKGEEAVFSVFQTENYDAICSDDKRFIKRLRLFQVPYLTPAVLVALMFKERKITANEALQKLETLSPMISDEEHFTVKALLTKWRKP